MKRRIALYINGQQVDIDNQSFVLFNYQQEDLYDPAVVKNSFTQEITLPGTPRNNTLLGGMYRNDRYSASDINPLAKTPFVIYNEMSEVLERGYVKFGTISRRKDVISYKITLYGGLGGFFYQLMYNDDGSKRTLADMMWESFGDGEWHDPKTERMSLKAGDVADAWEGLRSEPVNPVFEFLTFVPAYNGYPSGDFSADRAIYTETGSMSGYPNLYTIDEDYHTTSAVSSETILVEMQNKHTEWEVQDLRAYLQRPALKISNFLDAIGMNVNGYRYEWKYNADVFDYVKSIFMTLPMFDRKNLDPNSFLLADLLKGTASPAEYLIGFAKMFGLVFVYDSSENKVTLMSRNEYYSSGTTIDLSGRIASEKDISLYPMDAKYYIFALTNYGKFAADYLEQYGRAYGSEYVNTGYDFNADQKQMFDGLVFKGAADVLDSNINYQVFGGNANPDMGDFTNCLFKFALTEKVQWKLYKAGDNGEDEKTCEPLPGWIAPLHYSKDLSNYNDFMPKVQLEKDGKTEDGSNVLLFFEGLKDLPYTKQGSVVIQSVDFHLSDDRPEMTALNGKPCWDITNDGDTIVPVMRLPSFRRWHFLYDDAHDGIAATLDFGDPQAIGTDDVLLVGKNLYTRCWQKYIADRFDKDTRVVTCKVDWSGYKVDRALLRNIYFFDNAYWVLNKIINHSLTTYDLTECEFVKVKDTANYTNGQNYSI